MIGLDDSADDIGVIPSAISWLYQLIDKQKQLTGARFSVRVSAVELTGRQEMLRDLLDDSYPQGLCTVTNVTASITELFHAADKSTICTHQEQ